MIGSRTDLLADTNGFPVYGVTRRASCNKEFTGQGVE
jgi:hypothetical protein